MTVETFYAIVAGTCFALVGLFWNVVSARPDLMQDKENRSLAGGIFLAFLIPALMSLGAQIGGDNKLVWRGVFVTAALLGGFFTARLILATSRGSGGGFFRNSRWLSVLLYGVILIVALFPDLGKPFGLTGLQVEAFLICFLLLLGHGLAWDFLTQSKIE